MRVAVLHFAHSVRFPGRTYPNATKYRPTHHHCPARTNCILHIDGCFFFASCEIALDSNLEGRPGWVGGGIVIAANRLAKSFSFKTDTAGFEVKRLCLSGVLCKLHYEAYRELSRQMFLILEQYSPTLVPYSTDESFLDYFIMDAHMWRNTTPTEHVQGNRERIVFYIFEE